MTFRQAEKYIDSGKLLEEVIISKKQGKLTPNCYNMLIQLCDNSMKSHGWINKNNYRKYAFNEMSFNFMNYNEVLNSNPYLYFNELFKRGIAKAHVKNKRIDWRKNKINKLF